jgi:hypothetical protein
MIQSQYQGHYRYDPKDFLSLTRFQESDCVFVLIHSCFYGTDHENNRSSKSNLLRLGGIDVWQQYA